MKARDEERVDGMEVNNDLSVIYVKEIIEGKEGAQISLYGLHAAALMRHAARTFTDWGFSDADDLAPEAVNDAFYVALKLLEKFDPARGTFISWMYAITDTACAGVARKQGRHLRHASLEQMQEDGFDFPSSGISMEEQIVSEDQVNTLFDQMPPKYRDTPREVWLGDSTQREVAERLGKGRGPIGKHMSQAKKLLLTILQREGGEDGNDR
jgi:RNA polymerase sigma factor (sigma-70 family)